jgi:hypothetical protein
MVYTRLHKTNADGEHEGKTLYETANFYCVFSCLKNLQSQHSIQRSAEFHINNSVLTDKINGQLGMNVFMCTQKVYLFSMVEKD